MIPTGTSRSVGRGGRLLALLALLSLVVPAASLPAGAAEATPPRIAILDLQVDADGMVQVFAAVSPDVTEQEALTRLRVRENGEVVTDVAAQFVAREGGTTTASTEVALVVDTSGSTADDGALTAAKAAATSFVELLADRGVPLTVIAFDDAPRVVAARQSERAAAVAAIDGLQPGGETALYDAVDLAVGVLASSAAQRRELVLFTDGGDTASTGAGAGAGPSAVTARAAAAGVRVTAVSLQTSETDADALDVLATGTEGVVLPVTAADALAEVLGGVAQRLASQLLVTYPTPNLTAPELEVVLSLELVRGVATSEPRSVRNPLVEVPGATLPEPTAPRPVAAPAPLLLSGAPARFVALAATAAATWLLAAVALTTSSRRRSSRILRDQLAPSRRRPRKDAEPQLDLRERVAAVFEAVPRRKDTDARIQEQLERAAWPLRTSEYLALRAGLALGGALVGWALTLSGTGGTNLLVPLLLGVLGWTVPWLVLQQRREKRTNAFQEQIADTLQMLAGSLRAGYGLLQGMDNVAHEGQSPTSIEFGRAITEIRLGIAVEDALAAMADRVGSEDFRWVTVAISIQRKVGGNLAELLDTVANTLRERDAVRRQVSVLSAEGRLSAIVLIALPLGFALYLGIAQPSYLAPLFTTGIGVGLLVAAVALMGLGVVWIRAVVRIDV